MSRPYYKAETGYEAISVIQEWRLGFSSGNVLKYICRAGDKPSNSKVSDLKKVLAYLDFEIDEVDKLRLGITTQPVEDYVSTDISNEIVCIGDAWSISSKLINVLMRLYMANECRKSGFYEEGIRHLEVAVELTVEELKESEDGEVHT